jgi:hypothetical protein
VAALASTKIGMAQIVIVVRNRIEQGIRAGVRAVSYLGLIFVLLAEIKEIHC